MQINTYLAFDGRCKEAFEFYQSILGGEILMMMTYRDSPMAEHTPADQLDRVMHTTYRVKGNILMGADAPSHFGKPTGFSVSIGLDDVDECRRVFDALSEDGSILMPFEKSFFSTGFGMLFDKYGIPWMVNCQAPV
ncbi:VOC family protein [Capsulimonas corticalis]|uniref:VOC family protein n=2 Tax=Capsulimonas corticalis TaxID=2219043 RepID=A0A402D3K2_9BACT|nr:VOC family protein [Capsulimonas corticalis]